jgi:hypothetical protein
MQSLVKAFDFQMKQRKESWAWGTGESGYKTTRKRITVALNLAEEWEGT